MLNVKYFIFDDEGQPKAQPNPDHLGNAWFVDQLIPVENANQAILALDTINPRSTAIVESNQFSKSAKTYDVQSSDKIQLESYSENELTYSYTIEGERLALFSEIYYPQGWKVSIDGEEVTHFRANYVLRALELPAGKHQITFSFQPDVVKFGGRVSLASFIILVLVMVGGIIYRLKYKQIQQ
jgi:uncharacterized membrane protein YfhO